MSIIQSFIGTNLTISGGPTYIVRIKSYDVNTSTPGGVITSCNEGDVIWIEVEFTNLIVSSVGGGSYLQVGGVNITNQELSSFGPVNALDPVPFGSDSGGGPNGTTGAPLTVIADDTTEGNETLTWSWYVNGQVVATTSCSIVDTSTTPIVTTHTHTATQSAANDGSTAVHIDTNPTNDEWASTVPVGAIIVADLIGTFTVTGIDAPGQNGSANWFFVVTPNNASFFAGATLTFTWQA